MWSRSGVGGGVEVQGELVPRHLPERLGAAHVQRGGGAEVGQPGRTSREGGVEVQGVGQVDLGLDPHGALEGHLIGVHVDVPGIRGGLPATPGLGRHEPDDRLLDQPVHPGGPDPVRERGDLVVHEPRRRWAESPMVWRAIRRARHAGRSPASTRVQVRGSRCRSSRASPR